MSEVVSFTGLEIPISDLLLENTRSPNRIRHTGFPYNWFKVRQNIIISTSNSGFSFISFNMMDTNLLNQQIESFLDSICMNKWGYYLNDFSSKTCCMNVGFAEKIDAVTFKMYASEDMFINT